MDNQFKTADFRIDTRREATSNVRVENAEKKLWQIGIDVGYSSVKVFSPNCIAKFPSFAIKRTNTDSSNLLNIAPNKNDIIYKNLYTGEEWIVGEKAINSLSLKDTSETDFSVYNRDRYDSEMFKVLVETGLGFCSSSLHPYSTYGTPEDSTIVIQTGLPPQYMATDDKEALIDAFVGEHKFTLQVGRGPAIEFDFDVPKSNVFIMPQPMGTFMNICRDNNGNLVPEAKDYFNSSTLIFDPGFGTLDTYEIRGGEITGNSFTHSGLGMKRVFEEVRSILGDPEGDYRIDINSSIKLQQFLLDGKVPKFNRKTKSKEMKDFSSILEECSKKICQEALDKVFQDYHGLTEHKYLVVTGGTGIAWESMIRDYFKDIEGLTILPGNINDPDLSAVFSNVRGYYLHLYNQLKYLAG